MRGLRPNVPARTLMARTALGLLIVALLAACDTQSPPEATPIAQVSSPAVTATAFATPARPEPTYTVPPPSPTAVTAFATSSAGAEWAPTVRWRGGSWYLLGVNYPYVHYGNDFGGNAWGDYGVHDPKTYAEVDADFAKMSSLGIRAARWFLFADGRAGITYDAQGMPAGIDDFVFQDLDAALEIAQRHNIGLNLVLLDYRFLWDAQTVNGVQLGGHAAVLSTTAGQQALLHNVFEPVFRRYANHPAILSWEVMNEPEWTLLDAGSVDRAKIGQPLMLAGFRAFAQSVINSIHSVAQSYATIGSADMKWTQDWVGLGLDYYQIHYYDWMQPHSTDNLFAERAESLKLDRPIVVGEFPADHSTVAGLRDYLDTWYRNGFAGAWAWSFRADTTWGGPDPTVLHSWADAHQSVVDIPAAP